MLYATVFKIHFMTTNIWWGSHEIVCWYEFLPGACCHMSCVGLHIPSPPSHVLEPRIVKVKRIVGVIYNAVLCVGAHISLWPLILLRGWNALPQGTGQVLPQFNPQFSQSTTHLLANPKWMRWIECWLPWPVIETGSAVSAKHVNHYTLKTHGALTDLLKVDIVALNDVERQN